MSKTLCAALALVLLTACETSGRATDAACVAFRPVYVSKADVLTEETAQQLLTHNRTGARLCGWKPSKGRGP